MNFLFWRRSHKEDDLKNEIESHLQLAVDDHANLGESPEEARHAARREFGNVDVVREVTRDQWGRRWLDGLLQDIRYGTRILHRSPGLTAVAVLTVALGIGANTTIFSLVYGLLLRPLPYLHPGRIVMVWEKRARENNLTNVVSPADYLDWKGQNRSFEHMAEFSFAPADLLGGSEPERVAGASVGAEFFKVLGVRPALGRFFEPEEDKPGHNATVVLSYGLWQRRFGGDSNLIGRSINIDTQAATVVGVLPQDFEFPYVQVELWRPLPLTEMFHHNRGSHFLLVFARLRPQVTLQQAQAEMSAIAARLEAQYPDINRGHSTNVLPLREELMSGVRPALVVLSIAVSFLLLIACANVSNLLLANGVRRQREVAVRCAIGAGRSRLVRQFLTESLLLALLAGGGGALLALWGIQGLGPLLERSGLGVSAPKFQMNFAILSFLAEASVLSCMLFGLAPAVNVSRTDVLTALKGEGAIARVAGGNERLRAALLVGEVALSSMLLIGAFLMLRTFMQLRLVPAGFRADRVVALPVLLNSARYGNDSKKTAFFEQLTSRAAAIPEVESTGGISILPLSGNDSRTGITIEGRAPTPGEPTRAHHRQVTPGYFETVGIPLQAGRTFGPGDTSDSTPVVVINHTAARLYWPGQDVIGKRFRLGGESKWREVVGVVGDVKEWGLDQQVNPEMYLPLTQDPTSWMNIVVRTGRTPSDVGAALKAEVLALDKDQPVGTVKSLNEIVAQSIAPRAVYLALLGLFAAVALVLTTAGIYGVVSNVASQQTREIGIRMALGAQAIDVLTLTMKHGLQLVAAGLVLGIAGSFALYRVMRSLLYGVSASDSITLVLVSALIAVVATLACFIPARRAARVEPMVALRYE